MFYDQRRRKRRRNLILPVVASVVIGAFVLVGSLSRDTLVARDFYDATMGIVIDLQSDAETFMALTTSPFVNDRDEYVAELEQVEGALEEALTTLPAREDLPIEVTGTLRLATRTLEQWQLGVASYKAASLMLVDEPGSGIAEIELADALAELRVADELYLVLIDEMDALRVDLDIGELNAPDVQFVPANASTAGFVAGLASRLREAEVLAGRRDIAILNVVTSPAPLGGEDFDVERLPFTETVEIQVVVLNSGNQPEEGLSIALVVQNVDSQDAVQESRTIELLDSGAQEAVSFADIPVQAGQLYRVTVFIVTSVVDLATPGAETFDFFVSQDAEIPDTTTTTAP